jgi:hypothetical protein
MELKLISKWKALALSAYPVESAGNEAWVVQQNLPRHPLKIILKDGLSILIRLLQMSQAMKAEWNIRDCILWMGI